LHTGAVARWCWFGRVSLRSASHESRQAAMSCPAGRTYQTAARQAGPANCGGAFQKLLPRLTSEYPAARGLLRRPSVSHPVPEIGT
jgi:hypothetical protein